MRARVQPLPELADIITLMRRPIAILLTVLIALNTLAGGAGGIAVLCLGGGHEHDAAETEHCESACSHGESFKLALHTSELSHSCECTDIEITFAELTTLPRVEAKVQAPVLTAMVPAWNTTVQQCGLGGHGPPVPPPWFDPGGEHRLVVIASVRLTT